MSDNSMHLFISYSRKDGAFVDRLQADLQARGFNAWVDRRKLEGGQDWQDAIESAINRSQVVLIVLSPDSLESPWVKKEIGYAQDAGKHLIPLKLKPVAQVPIRLNGIQWVEFERRYTKALAELLILLSSPDLIVEDTKSQTTPPDPSTETSKVEELVLPHPAPPKPDPDLNKLYVAGVEAKAAGNLEKTAILWQQILDKDPNFGAGIVATQMPTQQELARARKQRLINQIRSGSENAEWRQVVGAWQAMLEDEPNDLQAQLGLQNSLRNLAKKAAMEGEWGEEIGAWETLLHLLPNDPELIERKSIAEQNLQWAWMYENAREFVERRQLAAARDALMTLWTKAPYYGDPSGIAQLVQISIPPSYDEAKAQYLAIQAAQKERVKIAREEHARQLQRNELKANLRQHIIRGLLIGLGIGFVGGICLLNPATSSSSSVVDTSTSKPLTISDIITVMIFGSLCLLAPIGGGIGAGIGAIVGRLPTNIRLYFVRGSQVGSILTGLIGILELIFSLSLGGNNVLGTIFIVFWTSILIFWPILGGIGALIGTLIGRSNTKL